jgi:hypothetical protein
VEHRTSQVDPALPQTHSALGYLEQNMSSAQISETVTNLLHISFTKIEGHIAQEVDVTDGKKADSKLTNTLTSQAMFFSQNQNTYITVLTQKNNISPKSIC